MHRLPGGPRWAARRRDSYSTSASLLTECLMVIRLIGVHGVSCESTFTTGRVKAPDARTKHRGRSTHTAAPAGNAATAPTPSQGSVRSRSPTKNHKEHQAWRAGKPRRNKFIICLGRRGETFSLDDRSLGPRFGAEEVLPSPTAVVIACVHHARRVRAGRAANRVEASWTPW